MYQFIHVETYSKVSAKKKLKEDDYNNETKGRNVSDIIKEVTRKQGYCDHVAEPEAPVVLYGVDPQELEALTEDYFNNTKLTNSKGVTRGLRKDSHILLAGVISLNRECDSFWHEYKQDSIAWLKEKYGEHLKCVVEHTDEANPHLHFYCVQDAGKDFNLLHEGKRAFASEKLKYKKEIAFKNAMRDFQEDFYNSVSLKHGLMKTGPRRQRLSNEDYKRQQQEIKLINLYKNKTSEEMELLIQNTQKQIKEQEQKAKTEIDSLKKREIANATKSGEKLGFQQAIKEFESKNVFNKFVFSRAYSANQITLLEKRNAALLNKNKKLFQRKELYKKQVNENSDYKNKFEYLKEVTQFINNFNLDSKENKNDDVERNIIREVERITLQQQQIDGRIKNVRVRNESNNIKINSVRSKLERAGRFLLANVRSFVGNFKPVKLCKEPEKIKKIIFIEETTNTREEQKHTERRDFTVQKNHRFSI